MEDGEATRIESRWGSADANPYLALAGCLSAGSDGLAEDFELPPMVGGDPHVDASLERLPTSLEGAVTNLEQSDFARRVYGEVFMDTYVTMLRQELSQFARSITDWERERYQEVM